LAYLERKSVLNQFALKISRKTHASVIPAVKDSPRTRSGAETGPEAFSAIKLTTSNPS